MVWYFDKNTIRVLRYVYYRNGVSGQKIRRRFKKMGDYAATLILCLSEDGYLVAKNSKGIWLPYSCDAHHSLDFVDMQWRTTAKSNVIVQADTLNLWRWLLPVVISTIAIIISVANFILNIFS
jgi:hypothetical protein